MKWMLNPDRYFSPQKDQRKLARSLYLQAKDLPIVSPHGHVNPRLFSTLDATFGSPTDLLIIPDHYVVRMLYSQGISLESLGIPDRNGETVEADHRKIWQIFADHYTLFRGTPSGGWIDHSLNVNLDIQEKLNGESAQHIYDQIQEKLQSDEFKPRNLLTKINIEILCTTDAASDSLDELKVIRKEKFGQKIYPTFRPDAVTNLAAEGWLENIENLSTASGIEVVDYHSYIHALEQRRAFFKTMGAHSADHGVYSASTQELSPSEAEVIFQRALKNEATSKDAARFTSHMLMEMARMSSEDGLVMQIHVGSYRNHNDAIFQKFGADKGFDIPVTAEFSKALRPLLNKFGKDSNLNLILFCLDEDVYSRELAPLAGVYPTVKLGPPWWFYDSPNGMKRYFDRVMETTGIYNTAGFNDDTRAFLSIPARHDVWRRVSCDWLAELVLSGRIDEEDAHDMAYQLAYGLVKKVYHFE
ncbi:MAG: glucuronate isomerase [Anaerolineaceae bacterium]|nr:glucuronate isomerase [Anaerolineaceae bacterium]